MCLIFIYIIGLGDHDMRATVLISSV